jgi:tetratricopeptide (TPR) repeat protein
MLCQVKSLPLILALVIVFMESALFSSSGMYDCYCSGHPIRTDIQERMWYMEAYNFLYGDYCYGPNDYDYHSDGIQYLSQTPNSSSANFWFNEANKLYLSGSYEKAVESYSIALNLDPSRFEGWLNMANALYFLNRFQESLTSYDIALKLEPTNAYALRGKNQVLMVFYGSNTNNAA